MNAVVFMMGGGSISSVNYNATSSLGEGIAYTGNLSSANFDSLVGEAYIFGLRIAPVTPQVILDLRALTDVLGNPIPEATWQKDADPYFYWIINIEPQETVKGFSVSLDTNPAEEINTESTFYQFPEQGITSGKHTFYVLPYLQGKGWDAASMLKFEIWVDRDPPVINQARPLSGELTRDGLIPISCILYDGNSGLDLASTTLTLNNNTLYFTYDEKEQLLKFTPATPLSEEKNTVLLKAYDLVGNYVVQGWDFIVDMHGPRGSILINNGEEFTHSAYVSISIKAEDSVSGIKNIYLSNDGVFDAELTHPYSYAPLISNWLLSQPDVDGLKKVYAKFEDIAGNISETFHAQINLKLLTPDTRIISGPQSITEEAGAQFKFESSKTGSEFSYKLDNLDWSAWSVSKEAGFSGLNTGNHHFYVKSGIDLNGDGEIGIDEEDATPAQWAWTIKLAGEAEKAPKKILFWRR